MNNNWPKLYPDKTEFIVIGTKHSSEKNSELISAKYSRNKPYSECQGKVKNLCVTLDPDLSISQHVSSVVRSCYCNIRDSVESGG